MISLPDVSTWLGVCALPETGVMLAQGIDAASFVHGQISQDVVQQPATQARLGAYCSAKGRMLASMLLLRPDSDSVLMLTDAQVLPATLKRLQMFVMRSKLKLSNESEHTVVLGIVGHEQAQQVPGFDASALTQPYAAQVMSPNLSAMVRLPDVSGQARWLWLGPPEAAQALLQSLPALPAQAWAWLDVLSGVPHIQAPTVDQFVPQMVNFEVLGGVHFQKGCYPGQEVVARSQYRGTAKRRLFLAYAPHALQVGQEVFAATDPAQPAGMVVNAAWWPDSPMACAALVELKLASADALLHAGGIDGPALTLGTLPYDVSAFEV